MESLHMEQSGKGGNLPSVVRGPEEVWLPVELKLALVGKSIDTQGSTILMGMLNKFILVHGEPWATAKSKRDIAGWNEETGASIRLVQLSYFIDERMESQEETQILWVNPTTVPSDLLRHLLEQTNFWLCLVWRKRFSLVTVAKRDILKHDMELLQCPPPPPHTPSHLLLYYSSTGKIPYCRVHQSLILGVAFAISLAADILTAHFQCLSKCFVS